MLLHCVPQLACKSVKRVDTCFSSSKGQANPHPVSLKNTVLKMNVLSNLSCSELSIDMAS